MKIYKLSHEKQTNEYINGTVIFWRSSQSTGTLILGRSRNYLMRNKQTNWIANKQKEHLTYIEIAQ